MSYFNHPSELVPATVDQSRPSFLQRVLDAIAHEPQHASERLWIDLIERNGGRLTDEVERKIALHL